MDGAARVPDDAAAPLVDPAVLADMTRDFSDPVIVHRFAQDFSATLEGKLDRLELRLAAGDATGAEDAVLSVTTSARMVGALRLDRAAGAIHGMITADDLHGARGGLVMLRVCSTDTIAELRAAYPENPEPTTLPS